MPAIIPKDISRCWTYEDPGIGKIVKACQVALGSHSKRNDVVNTKQRLENPIGDLVKKCNPKKDKLCNIHFGNDFYKECDPKDKKCKIDLGRLVLGVN
jgi:hypothetical protein